ncbi:helix-turn-helix domain-containing protein [Microbacterium sp. BWT-B31]|uniref:helix-turn-helix domain-containing protein n=1 Tax=Microbacterium sp. BWT-B31 TaxID=3232072 RepID=UPI003527A896
MTVLALATGPRPGATPAAAVPATVVRARQRSRRTPFLTAAAAAAIAGVKPATMLRRLTEGALPGYRLGGRWFIPEAELRLQLRRRIGMSDGVEVADAVGELTAHLPRMLNLIDLETFLGLRRPHVYRVLLLPGLAGVSSGRVTTRGVLDSLLIASRNDCPPCRTC